MWITYSHGVKLNTEPRTCLFHLIGHARGHWISRIPEDATREMPGRASLSNSRRSH
jgi:hypothetical protein